MNKKDILVTVKCTVYNHESYLRQCLDGFVMQRTRFNFEVLVHDDASSDESARIIKEYAKKYPQIIIPIFEETNQYSQGGFYRIISIMNEKIRGKYIAICEGDDFWIDEYKLQKQVDYMEKHPECGLVYTKMKQLNQLTGKVTLGWAHQAKFKEIITTNNPISTPTTLMRKDIYDDFYSKVNVDKSWKMADYPLWLYISYYMKIKCLDDVTTTYRILPNSASHNTNFKKNLDFIYSGYDISLFFVNYFKEDILLPQIHRHVQNCIFDLGRAHHKKVSFEVFKYAFKTKSLTVRLLVKIFCFMFKF